MKRGREGERGGQGRGKPERHESRQDGEGGVQARLKKDSGTFTAAKFAGPAWRWRWWRGVVVVVVEGGVGVGTGRW